MSINKFRARRIIALGLITSAVLNILFGTSSFFIGGMALIWTFAIIWFLNGYFQSMGWAPTVKTIANWFSKEERGKISGFVGTSYILGGAISTVLAAYPHSLSYQVTTFAIFPPMTFVNPASIISPRIRLPNPFVNNDGKPILVVVHGNDFADMLNTGFQALGGLNQLIDNNQNVLIKPNLFTDADYPVISSDQSVLALVEEVQNVIFNNLSKRLAVMIKEEMDYMGPIRLKDVEEAQQKVVNIIRKLEDAGEIVISRGGGDEIIV